MQQHQALAAAPPPQPRQPRQQQPLEPVLAAPEQEAKIQELKGKLSVQRGGGLGADSAIDSTEGADDDDTSGDEDDSEESEED